MSPKFSGSSPRVRGTPPLRSRFVHLERIIPARAGNANSKRSTSSPGPDHPRACGERDRMFVPGTASDGSSPRVRGTRARRARRDLACRIIPARAGNAGVVTRWTCASPDHPRACGERIPREQRHASLIGSSPRVRGTRTRTTSPSDVLRIIPARAGNASGSTGAASRPPDHPRACGERLDRDREVTERFGSSPRVRGTPWPRLRSPAWPRIIPARAGNASVAETVTTAGPDHPRACGERSPPLSCVHARNGSSPRVRGTQLEQLGIVLDDRIIPARAGNAAEEIAEDVEHADHPRACGERRRLAEKLRAEFGSSPRVRGTPVPFVVRHAWRRIIPARAGNATYPASRYAVRPDHPRACGERAAHDIRSGLSTGSSPRVRGTRAPAAHLHTGRRIIPARAGNAEASDPQSGQNPDHPRACGERCVAASCASA